MHASFSQQLISTRDGQVGSRTNSYKVLSVAWQPESHGMTTLVLSHLTEPFEKMDLPALDGNANILLNEPWILHLLAYFIKGASSQCD